MASPTSRFLNDYITPRGLLVNNTGSTTQILAGLVLDVYKDKAGFINDISFVGGVWNDLWSDQHDPRSDHGPSSTGSSA